MPKAVLGTLLILVVAAAASAQVSTPDSSAKFLSGQTFKISPEDEEAGISGTIKLAVDLSETGAVKDVLVYLAPDWPCSSEMDKRMRAVLKNAEEAVKTFRFAPAVKNGKPVDSRVGISLTVGKAVAQKGEDASSSGQATRKATTISAGNVNGKAIALPTPAYPSEAKAAGVRGTVLVRVTIDETGKVRSAQAVDGHGMLQFAARAAACQAKFAPTLLQGQPVKVTGVITYNFL